MSLARGGWAAPLLGGVLVAGTGDMYTGFAPQGPVGDGMAELRVGVGVVGAMVIGSPFARGTRCLWQGQMVPFPLLRVEGQ